MWRGLRPPRGGHRAVIRGPSADGHCAMQPVSCSVGRNIRCRGAGVFTARWMSPLGERWELGSDTDRGGPGFCVAGFRPCRLLQASVSISARISESKVASYPCPNGPRLLQVRKQWLFRRAYPITSCYRPIAGARPYIFSSTGGAIRRPLAWRAGSHYSALPRVGLTLQARPASTAWRYWPMVDRFAMNS